MIQLGWRLVRLDGVVKVYYFGLRKISYMYLLEKIRGKSSGNTDVHA